MANKLTDKVTHVVFKGGRKTVRTHRAHHLPCGPPVGCPRRCRSPRTCAVLHGPRLSALAWQTWDAATAKGIPLVSPMWVAAAETEEECADPSDHRAAMPKPSDGPQKSMEPVPVRHQEPPESSSQARPRSHHPLEPLALPRPSLLSQPRPLRPSLLARTPACHEPSPFLLMSLAPPRRRSGFRRLRAASAARRARRRRYALPSSNPGLPDPSDGYSYLLLYF